MKKLFCLLLVMMLVPMPALAENPDTGSWGQINQAISTTPGPTTGMISKIPAKMPITRGFFTPQRAMPTVQMTAAMNTSRAWARI